MSFLTSFSQNVVTDANNSSTANINSGVTFVGTATSTLGVAGIQVSLKTDQNSIVYIDQSPGLGTGTGTVTTNGSVSLSGSGTDFLARTVGDQIYVSGENVRIINSISSNTLLTVSSAFSTSGSGLSYQMYDWDLTDNYDYYASLNNFGVTVQAINSYLRVRVKNNSSSNSTYFRLQTVLCPIVEAVPRSLDAEGNFKTAIKSTTDHYGFEVENTPMGETRTITPVRLVGTAFEGTTIDSNFWAVSGSNSATASQGNAQLLLSSGTNSAGAIIVNSTRRARYVSGSSMRWRANFQLGDTGTINNTRAWGVGIPISVTPYVTDGAYFQLDGTTFSIVTMKNSSPTTVSSGAFNGTLGSAYAPTTSVTTYEIYWTNGKVYFVVGDNLLHLVSASTATWSSTMNHYIFAYNINNGNTTNVTLASRNNAIHRLGNLITQPTSSHIVALTTGTVLKYGPGNLHSIVLNNITNNSVVTVYDNTAASGTTLWSFSATANTLGPMSLDFKGIPFFIGLTVVVSSATTRLTIIYE